MPAIFDMVTIRAVQARGGNSMHYLLHHHSLSEDKYSKHGLPPNADFALFFWSCKTRQVSNLVMVLIVFW